MSTTLPHTAKTVFFGCIDDRLAHTIEDFLASHGDAFTPRLAGGGAAFLADPEREVALKQIVAAYLINGVTDVYVQSHTDCGAYRLAGVEFGTPEEEIARLYSDLEAATVFIREALVKAGAKADELTINVQVVDPTGTAKERINENQLSAFQELAVN